MNITITEAEQTPVEVLAYGRTYETTSHGEDEADTVRTWGKSPEGALAKLMAEIGPA